jgi:hypothetical protein
MKGSHPYLKPRRKIMGSILNVSGVSTAAPTAAVAQKPQAAPIAAQPTLAQLLQEPTFELTQQALEGNTQAAQILAQQQATNALAAPAAATGAAPGVAGINILA